MLDFFTTTLQTLDPDVHDLIGYEAERQARKIILIPSESQAPEAVREALGSVFQNIYAEGYPNPDTHGLAQAEILDYEVQLARYRRFGDDRYYKGVEYADVVEALARQRAAEAFAANGVRAGGHLGQRAAALRLAGQQRHLCRAGPRRRDGHGHGPAARRPPDPRQPGEPLGQALQDRLVRHRPADRAAELRRRSRRWRARPSRR